MTEVTIQPTPAEAPATEAPAAGTVTPTAGGVPLIGGKFTSQDELLKAYQELEKRQGAGAVPPKPEAPATETPAAPVTPEDLRITKPEVTPSTGIDFTAAEKEAATTGAVSDETYAAFEAKGVSRQVLDSYIDGQRAVAERVTNELATLAGGADSLKAVLGWAGTNLSPAEVEAYNAALDAGNMGLVKGLLRGMIAARGQVEGTAPNLVNGERVPTTGGVLPFRSQAEMLAAMSDPKYDTDEAYRNDVIARVAASQAS